MDNIDDEWERFLQIRYMAILDDAWNNFLEDGQCK